MTKQLNTSRSALLKTEKIAVLNEGGTVEELREIFKEAFPKDLSIQYGCTKFYYKYDDLFWDCTDTHPDGYTAHPISWFYEADEAVKPTFEELKAMSLDDRIEVLKKMGYVDGAEYKSPVNGRDESFIIDTKRSEFGRSVTTTIAINGGFKGDWLMWEGKWAEIISKPDEAPQPEAVIIGWELMIDVPEVELKAGDKAFEIYKTVVTFPNRSSIFKSVIRQIGIPIYKRTTTDILNAVKQGTMSVEDAVKELEQK